MHAAPSHFKMPYGQADGVMASFDAEQSVLGLLMFDERAFDEVRDFLKAEHFREPINARLYDAMAKLLREGRCAAPELIAPKFATDSAFFEIGGARYLADLIDKAPPLTVVAQFAQEIVSAHTRRSVDGMLRRALSSVHSSPPEEVLGDVERSTAEIRRATFTREHWIGAGDLAGLALDSAEVRDGRIDFSLGLSELDQMTGGAHAGEVTLLAGRPGMAKTTVVGRVALANALQGRGTLIYSLEMAQEPMGHRLGCDMAYDRHAVRYSAAPEAGNPTVSLAMQNRLSPEQRSRLRAAEDHLRELPLLVDVRSGLTLSQIEAAARAAFRQWEKQGISPGPVFIDHLGKVRPEKDRGGNRHAEVADVSAGLAEMAKRLHVPVIACCQLNRAVEGRGDDKRPVLSDLRQAGELEEDARQVIFLYRPEYYYRPPEDPSSETAERRFERERKLDQVRNKLFFLVEKNSHGPTGQVEAFCDIACSAVRDRTA